MDKIDASRPVDIEQALQLKEKLAALFKYHGLHYTFSERNEPTLKRILFGEISIAIKTK